MNGWRPFAAVLKQILSHPFPQICTSVALREYSPLNPSNNESAAPSSTPFLSDASARLVSDSLLLLAQVPSLCPTSVR